MPSISVEQVEKKRTVDQNALMWALLTDIANQVEWAGKLMSPEDWKNLLTAKLRGFQVVPGIDEDGNESTYQMVALGLPTSSMTKARIAELIELMYWFGAERGVEWTE